MYAELYVLTEFYRGKDLEEQIQELGLFYLKKHDFIATLASVGNEELAKEVSRTDFSYNLINMRECFKHNYNVISDVVIGSLNIEVNNVNHKQREIARLGLDAAIAANPRINDESQIIVCTDENQAKKFMNYLNQRGFEANFLSKDDYLNVLGHMPARNLAVAANIPKGDLTILMYDSSSEEYVRLIAPNVKESYNLLAKATESILGQKLIRGRP